MTNNTIAEIKRNYQQLEKALIAELFMTVNAHHLTAGTFREKVWKGFFENIVPKKFTIEQGAFLIDSKGKVSGETDLVIFDEQYTPYVLKNRNIKFIPIEAVAAVIQCKSTEFKKNDLLGWEKSIDDLTPNCSGYAGSALNTININDNRIILPLKMICGLFDRTEDGTASFLDKESSSDLIIAAYSEKDTTNGFYRSKDKAITIHSKHPTIESVVREIAQETSLEYQPKSNEGLESVEKHKHQFKEIREFPSEKFDILTNKGGKKISLLTLVFQLNQYLMLINNPMFFPHRAYIEMFNDPQYDISDGEA